MKIVYISIYDNNPNSGVTKKLIYQVDALNDNGLETQLVLLCRENANRNIPRSYIRYETCPVPPYNGLVDKLSSNSGIKKVYTKLFSQLSENDIVYMRNHIPTRWFYNLLKTRRNKVFIEIVSNKFQEALLRRSYIFYASLKLYNDLIFSQVDGVISVTRDLVEKSYRSKIKTPVVIIGNGIEIENIPLRKKFAEKTQKINLTCVANVAKWHGLDRLMQGISKFDGAKEFHLNIVGGGAEIGSLTRLAKELAIEDQVTFQGFLKGQQLDEIMNLTDIGISNLGTFRKNIKYTSPLKSREYCARGIPFIYTCIDDDFPADFPYAFQLPADETPIDITRLKEFYRRVNSDSDCGNYMRNFAANNLTWKNKIVKLLNFIKRLERETLISSA